MIITTFNLILRDSVSQKTSCQNLVNLKIMMTSLVPLTIAINLKPMQWKSKISLPLWKFLREFDFVLEESKRICVLRESILELEIQIDNC